MNDKLSSARIRLALQVRKRLLRKRILRIRFIVRPGKHHLARAQERADVIHMFVRLILIDSTRQPQHFFYAKISSKLLLDLLARKPRIAPRTQKARLRHQKRPLTVAVNRSALQYKRRGIVTRIAILYGKRLRKRIVQRPGCIQSIHRSAPGVK